MSNPLTHSLARLFRDRVRTTSVKQLQKEGFRRVQVLDLAHLEDVVRMAVERVLLSSAVDPEQGQRLARDAHVEFLRMLDEREALERTTEDLRREQSTLEFHREELQRALAAAKADLDQGIRARATVAAEELHQRLDTTLKEIVERARRQQRAAGLTVEQALNSLEGPLQAAMMALLSQALRMGTPSQATEDSGTRVELLQKRVRKLNASLTEAREMMQRLREQKATEEEGVASVYRETQGLSGKEIDYEQRHQLLSQVFRLNLELKHEIEGASGSLATRG